MLKMLRECMMLEIPGWCPLYTGCGFGTNWYDAKKTEIPVQVQQKMVDTWGESGLDWWDGDTDKLFYWEVGEINDYKRDRVINYMKNKDNWGKVLSPVENGFAHEVLDEIKIGRHVDGVVDKDVSSKKDMLENLEEFSKAFGIMDLFKQADIQKPDYSATNNTVDLEEDDREEDKAIKVDPREIMKARVDTFGACFLDTDGGKRLYFNWGDGRFRVLVKQILQRNPGDIECWTIVDGKEMFANMKTNMSAYSQIVSVYMSWKQMQGHAAG
jgi:hypothetical protein